MAIGTNESVAAKVRGLAAEKRLTYAQLAAALNVSPMAMSRRMNGQTPLTAGELHSLAVAMDVPIARFFPDPGTPEFETLLSGKAAS